MKNTKKSSSKNQKKNSLTIYVPVSNHIYNYGSSYRIRVSINGKTVSVSTKTKKEAYRVRKQLLELRSAA